MQTELMVPLQSWPGIEDLIDKSYTHCPSNKIMHSIWNSPAWHSLGSFTPNCENLTFSFYIDWFNPLTNKIAGKSISCSAIMMFCLNLPYEIQHPPSLLASHLLQRSQLLPQS